MAGPGPRPAPVQLRLRSLRSGPAPRHRHRRGRRRSGGRSGGRRRLVRRNGAVRREDAHDPDAGRLLRDAPPSRLGGPQARCCGRGRRRRRDRRSERRARASGAVRLPGHPSHCGSAGLPRSFAVPPAGGTRPAFGAAPAGAGPCACAGVGAASAFASGRACRTDPGGAGRCRARSACRAKPRDRQRTRAARGIGCVTTCVGAPCSRPGAVGPRGHGARAREEPRPVGPDPARAFTGARRPRPHRPRHVDARPRSAARALVVASGAHDACLAPACAPLGPAAKRSRG